MNTETWGKQIYEVHILVLTFITADKGKKWKYWVSLNIFENFLERNLFKEWVTKKIELWVDNEKMLQKGYLLFFPNHPTKISPPAS